MIDLYLKMSLFLNVDISVCSDHLLHLLGAVRPVRTEDAARGLPHVPHGGTGGVRGGQ